MVSETVDAARLRGLSARAGPLFSLRSPAPALASLERTNDVVEAFAGRRPALRTVTFAWTAWPGSAVDATLSFAMTRSAFGAAWAGAAAMASALRAAASVRSGFRLPYLG